MAQLVRVATMIPRTLKRALEQRAHAEQRSVSHVIRRALEAIVEGGISQGGPHGKTAR